MPTSSIFSDFLLIPQKPCGTVLIRLTLSVPEQAADIEYKKLDERYTQAGNTEQDEHLS